MVQPAMRKSNNAMHATCETHALDGDVRRRMLRSFWFTTSSGLGYGATGYDQADAEALLQTLGYPAKGVVVTGVTPDVKHADLEQNQVVPNIGPMLVRGVWFPRHNV